MISNPTKITVTAKFSPKTEVERENLVCYLKSAPAVFNEYYITQEQTSEDHDNYLIAETLTSRNDDLRFPDVKRNTNND